MNVKKSYTELFVLYLVAISYLLLGITLLSRTITIICEYFFFSKRVSSFVGLVAVSLLGILFLLLAKGVIKKSQEVIFLTMILTFVVGLVFVYTSFKMCIEFGIIKSLHLMLLCGVIFFVAGVLLALYNKIANRRDVKK